MALAAVLPHEALPVQGRPTSPWDGLRLGRALVRAKAGSIFLTPGYNAPWFSKVPFVFTMHDLNHLDRPENSSLAKRLYYAAVLKPACRRASAVLTVSEFSRRRIIEWSGVDGAKVFNVGNGVDAAYTAEGSRHSPGFPYLLMVSNRKRHKNEARVVQAFAQARLDPALQLLFTGISNDELRACVIRHGVEDRVGFTGLIDEGDMPSFYRGAQALVFPSLYEGFGLPLVEAFACGLPVITSRATALPEVAGEAALLVDAYSVDAIARAMERIATDQPLRDRLRASGLQRARDFRWRDVVARVQDVLQAVERLH